jgi:integrase
VGKARRLIRRAGIWHYRRRVPLLFADVDPRSHVEVSLDTRDLDRAEALKAQIEKAVEQRWLALKQGSGGEAEDRYQGAVELARLEGFQYRPAREIAQGSFAEILQRIDRLEQIGLLDETARTALLGGRTAPQLTVTAGWQQYLELTRDRQRKYSPDQLRRWKAPRQKAVNNLVSVVGDKPLKDVRRSDALALRAWWVDRVQDENLTAQSANKDIGHLAQIFRVLTDALELGIGAPFEGLRLEDEKAGQRATFTTQWIVGTLLADGALSRLNGEARAILQIMVETGLRPSEICGLQPDDILLGANVPHVKIVGGPGRRRLKTPYSQRDMPLIGISLEAMRAHPRGFPRYWDRSSTLSATVNKFMTENQLLPSERHSLYSLRHSFQDRLTAADAPDRIAADLMGHKFNRPLYGEGGTLEHKRDWLLKIAVSV